MVWLSSSLDCGGWKVSAENSKETSRIEEGGRERKEWSEGGVERVGER